MLQNANNRVVKAFNFLADEWLVDVSENAAELASGQIVSFQRMFESTGEQDEDAMTRGELLHVLYSMFSTLTFTAAEVLRKLDESQRHAHTFNEPEKTPNIDALRSACATKTGVSPSAKSIGRALSKIINAPVARQHGVIALRKGVLRGTLQFYIDLKAGEAK